MTTLNPSHNVFRHPAGRHAQAVHEPSPSFPDQLPSVTKEDDDLSIDSDLDERDRELLRAKREARRRVQGAMPPMPDLRFEQSYLLSIRPFLTPRPTPKALHERGPVPSTSASASGSASSSTPAGLDKSDQGIATAQTQSSEQDEVFHWGREMDVNWRMVAWVTARDQIVSPLVQGALWGWLTIFYSATRLYLGQTLYHPQTGRGRIGSGSGGTIERSGGGEAVAEAGGWWRNWVKSWLGGVEAAVA